MPRAPYFYPAAGSAAEAVSEQHSWAPARDDLAGDKGKLMTGNEESCYSLLQDQGAMTCTGGSELGNSLKTYVKGQESTMGTSAKSAGNSVLTLCLLLPCSFQSQTFIFVTGKTQAFNKRNKDDSWMHMNWYFPWNRSNQEKPIPGVKSFL